MAPLENSGGKLRPPGINWITWLVAAPIQAGFLVFIFPLPLGFHWEPTPLQTVLMPFYFLHCMLGVILVALVSIAIRGPEVAMVAMFLGGLPLSLLYAWLICALFMPFFQRAGSAGLRILRMLPGLVILGIAIYAGVGMYKALNPGPEKVAAREVQKMERLIDRYLVMKRPLSMNDAASQFQSILKDNHMRHSGMILRMDPARIGEDGRYLDPWGQAYAFGWWSEGGRNKGWAYSHGPNKTDEGGNGDDVRSWK